MLRSSSSSSLAAARRGARRASSAPLRPRKSGWVPPREARRAKAQARARKETVADALAAFPAFGDAPPEAWVRSWNGPRLGIVPLPREVWGCEPRGDVMLRVVEWQRQKNRPAVTPTLGRAEVSGSGKKPFKQKGTGQARRGTLKSAPHMKGGGKAHGPVARSMAHDLPKKVRRLGLQMALSAKLAEGNMVLFDKAWLPTHHTAYLGELVARHGLAEGGARTLVIDGDGDGDPNFELAASNLASVRLMPARAANVLDVLKHRNLAVTLAGARALERRLLELPEEPEPHEWEAVRESDSELVGKFAERVAAAGDAAAEEGASAQH